MRQPLLYLVANAVQFPDVSSSWYGTVPDLSTVVQLLMFQTSVACSCCKCPVADTIQFLAYPVAGAVQFLVRQEDDSAQFLMCPVADAV